MKNFKILKTDYINIIHGKKLEITMCKCNKCRNIFSMSCKTETNIENMTSRTFYEFKYCPHCANKLEVQDNEKLD